MQLQEQATSALGSLGWIGLDLLSLVELLFFFVVGYLVSKSPSWSGEAKGKIDGKTPDEILDADVAPTSSPSPSQAMKKNRKRVQKGKEEKEAQPEIAEAIQGAPVLVEEPLAENEWLTVETKATKKLAKQQEKKQGNLAMQERCSSKVDDCSVAPIVDFNHMLTEKDTDSTPSTQSQPDTDSLPELRDVDSQSASDSEVQDVAVTSSTPSHLDMESSPEMPDVDSKSTSEVEMPDVDSKATSEVEVVDAEVEVSGLCQISTPEMTPRKSLHTPMHINEGAQNFFMAPGREGQLCQNVVAEIQDATWNTHPAGQVEAWMPVAIPVEYVHVTNVGESINPSCFFNGFWQNSLKERITIEGFELKFENGPIWVMKEQNLRGFIVELNGEDFHAEIVSGGQQLLWSDGDIWNCTGRLQHERPPLWINDPGQLKCIMSTTEGPEMDAMPNPVTDDKSGDWKVCREWKKSKWCRKGAACKWEHPAEPDDAMQKEPSVPEAWSESDVCREWKKSKWCRKGAACKWKHPIEQEDVMQTRPSTPQMAPVDESAALVDVCWEWKKSKWCRKGAACKWKHPVVDDGNTTAMDASGALMCQTCA